ncbi:hypothetical protein ACOSQ2_013476 [Xanthoceras sorbifolium]
MYVELQLVDYTNKSYDILQYSINTWCVFTFRYGRILMGDTPWKEALQPVVHKHFSCSDYLCFFNNPYNGFIYTSFQERATFISHGNTAKLAKDHGDLKLAQICGIIAVDEKRHETAYTKVALAATMTKKIKMLAPFLYDGQDDSLFKHYSAVAQRLGVYTAKDYADILEFLVGRYGVEKLRMQDFMYGLPLRIRKLEERALERTKSHSSIDATVPFNWVFGREIGV